MNLAKRLLHGIKGALIWDNPLELLLDYHLLRRRDPIRLLKHGSRLVVDYKSSDMNAAHDIMIAGMYDQALDAAVSEVKNTRHFRYLNLGANIGVFDLRAWQIAKKKGLSIAGAALEMNTATFSRLVLNLELNNLLQILPINAALAAEDGQLPCELAARDTGQSAHEHNSAHKPTIQMVAAISWETLWKKVAGHFDLVKVDIEGAESVWLKYLTKDQARFLGHIVIETHSPDLHALCDRNLPDLGFKLLQKEASAKATRVSLWKKERCS